MMDCQPGLDEKKDCQNIDEEEEKWMLEKAEYTMNRFAQTYGMEYMGMATSGNETEKLAKKIE